MKEAGNSVYSREQDIFFCRIEENVPSFSKVFEATEKGSSSE